jgi:hypothetical protein
MVWMLVFALLFARPSPGRPSAGLDGLLELLAAGGLDERFQAESATGSDPGTSALFVGLGPRPHRPARRRARPYGGELLPATISAEPARRAAGVLSAAGGRPSRPSAEVETRARGTG